MRKTNTVLRSIASCIFPFICCKLDKCNNCSPDVVLRKSKISCFTWEFLYFLASIISFEPSGFVIVIFKLSSSKLVLYSSPLTIVKASVFEIVSIILFSFVFLSVVFLYCFVQKEIICFNMIIIIICSASSNVLSIIASS